MSGHRSNPKSRLSLVTTAEGASDATAGLDATALLDGSGVVGSGESDYALLRAGKIDVDEYMELSVDRALAHLEGQLPSEQLQAMRDVLVDAMRRDPQLSSLVARATG